MLYGKQRSSREGKEVGLINKGRKGIEEDRCKERKGRDEGGRGFKEGGD